jgi:hypothetical protein
MLTTPQQHRHRWLQIVEVRLMKDPTEQIGTRLLSSIANQELPFIIGLIVLLFVVWGISAVSGR